MLILKMIIKTKKRYTAQGFDQIALHPVLGPLVLVAVCMAMLQLLFLCCQPLEVAIEQSLNTLRYTLRPLLGESLLSSLLLDGVVVGVGSVAELTPVIVGLFICSGVLQDSGYLARSTRLLQRLLTKIGLPSQASTVILAGFACSVPAMFALRHVPSRSQRLIALFVTPFLPCSARLAIYSLFVAACFAHLPPLWGIMNMGTLVLFGLYVLGIFTMVATAFLLKGHFPQDAPQSPGFLAPLPHYRLPSPSSVLSHATRQVSHFWIEAGPIILATSVVLWGLFTFPRHMPLEQSYAGQLGKAIHPLFAPLGFDWRICVALLACFAAREAFIPTLAVAHGLQQQASGGDGGITLFQALAADAGQALYTPLSSLALLVFIGLSLQCMNTSAVCKRVSGSWKWAVTQWLYMMTIGWSAAFMVYQGGRAMGLH